MKKIIKSLLLLLVITSMLFSLTGCGDKENTKKEDKEEIVEQNQEKKETIEQKQETNVEQQEKPEFSMGEWNDNIYTNDFLGLKFNLPEEWIYSSQEDIAEMMNVGTELLNDDQKAAIELAKLNSVYYMVANNSNTGDSVTIVSEKPITEITAEYYINQLKTQLSAIQTITYEIGETSKEKISGIETNTLTVTGIMSGIEISQKYYVYNVDKYIVCIIVTATTGEDTINEIVENFE